MIWEDFVLTGIVALLGIVGWANWTYPKPIDWDEAPADPLTEARNFRSE